MAEKLRYEEIKKAPQRLAAEKEKRKQKYKKQRESGKKNQYLKCQLVKNGKK